MTTTAAAIRDAMLSLVEELTPAVEAGTPFRRFRETHAGGFREWARANPADCLRRFSVRYIGASAPTAVGNTLVEEPADTFEIVCAYPANLRFGSFIELDDVLDSDQRQVHARVGPPGYASFTAPATVLHDQEWARESDEAVVFAVIRYRVAYYRATGATNEACQLVGLNGQTYKTGDIITGAANLRALYLTNGHIKVTYEQKTPDSEFGAHTMYGKSGGEWARAVSTQYGDWSFFVCAFLTIADSATVIAASADSVEVAFEWAAHSLTTYPGGGVPHRDDVTNNPIYPEGLSSPDFRRITVVRLTKTIRIDRGVAGYFIGWHSMPRVGPPDVFIPLTNNETDWGERELGTGGGAAVLFSSAGVTSRHPAWGADARWAAAELALGYAVTNRVAWMGLDDQPYGSTWTNPVVIALENEGGGSTFPREQTTGPFWIGDIPDSTASIPFVRYIVLRERLEVGGWQFDGTQLGTLVVHFVNEFHNAAGLPFRHQLFLGFDPYTADSSSGYANEPKADLRARIATLAAGVVWPAT